MNVFLDREFPDPAEETDLGKFLPLIAALKNKKNCPAPLALPCLLPGRGSDRKSLLLGLGGGCWFSFLQTVKTDFEFCFALSFFMGFSSNFSPNK